MLSTFSFTKSYCMSPMHATLCCCDPCRMLSTRYVHCHMQPNRYQHAIPICNLYAITMLLPPPQDMYAPISLPAIRYQYPVILLRIICYLSINYPRATTAPPLAVNPQCYDLAMLLLCYQNATVIYQISSGHRNASLCILSVTNYQCATNNN